MLLFDALKAKSPPRQREAFRVTGYTPDNSAVKHGATLRREAPRGQARKRPGGWRRKEDGKDLRQLRRWFSRDEYRSEASREWGPVRITPDLRAVAVQATESRLTLVPPSNWEHSLETDDRLRCELKAEYRAKGYPVDTIRDLISSIEEEKREMAAIEAIRERARAQLGAASTEHAEERKRTEAGALGFTDKHRRAVKRACAVLSEYRYRVGLFTGTLAPQSTQAVARADRGISAVLTRFRRRVSREQRRRGLPSLHVDVTEIQLERYDETGIPVPHVHMAFVAKNEAKASAPWAISAERFQEMWDRSVAEVAGFEEPVWNKTQTEGVEYDVFGYLSKYLSKGAETTAMPWQSWPGLRPVRWWNQSKEMKAAVEARTVVVPGNFASWVETNENRLVEARLIRPVLRHCPEDAPVGEVLVWSFTRVTAIRDCLRLYLADIEEQKALWRRRLEIVDNEADALPPPALMVPSRDFEANELRTVAVSHAGCLGDRLSKAIERFERETQVSIPVLLPYIGFREENAVQLELLG